MSLDLFFHNSASNRIEKFEPIDSRHIRMYVCGPTVYDHIHVGNARPIVVFDVLFRLLRLSYPDSKVTYARNITDIDDKIIERSRKIGVQVEELTATTTSNFLQCCEHLGTLKPSFQPQATKYIKEMQSLICELITRNKAYAVGDGHVLCEVGKDVHYGSLSGRNKEEQIAGARVQIADYKRNPSDFILWKPSAQDEPGWDSPWGRGRPGWHTECVAMSSHILGFDFDIHGGGIDLLFPHHENELCQCRGLSSAHGFAKYWLHNGYVEVDGEKMSKSLGNFTYAKDLIAQYDGNIVKIALLMTHYRKPLNMNKQRLLEASQLYARCQQAWQQAAHIKSSNAPPQIDSKLREALANDLDTYAALQHLQQYASRCIEFPEKYGSQFLESASFLGLCPTPIAPALDSEQQNDIKKLLEKRELARKKRDFVAADTLRTEIETSYHVEIVDHNDKPSSWKPKC